MRPNDSTAQFLGIGLVALALLLPLLGAAATHRDRAPLFTFPPRLSIPQDYPRFSWSAVGLVLAPFFALGLSIAARRRTDRAQGLERPGRAPDAATSSRVIAPERAPFPRWGWIAVSWTAAWWLLAWTRFPWFAPVQRYTFFPLWLGFILVLNAATFSRQGGCMMTAQPKRWATLFATSALFWWGFEWLNRFTQNWHYLGVADFGATGYALHASLCFSTVLPAVAAAAELIGTFATWQRRFAHGPSWRGFDTLTGGYLLLLIGGSTLLAAGAWPTQAYAALWSGPLALFLGATVVTRGRGVPSDLARGDWRVTATWALAALGCGFFWELWNVRSAAKWIYTVPYVDRWHVFEMPLLGYLGYLPFGIESYCVAVGVLGSGGVRPFSSASST
jgi:hypothetical protein